MANAAATTLATTTAARGRAPLPPGRRHCRACGGCRRGRCPPRSSGRCRGATSAYPPGRHPLQAAVPCSSLCSPRAAAPRHGRCRACGGSRCTRLPRRSGGRCRGATAARLRGCHPAPVAPSGRCGVPLVPPPRPCPASPALPPPRGCYPCRLPPPRLPFVGTCFPQWGGTRVQFVLLWLW